MNSVGGLVESSVIETAAAVLTAVGTVAVAILAIWGDKLRAWLAGPKLALSLRDARGDLTTRADGRKTIYYHVAVSNDRSWSPAKAVRVLVVGVAKRRPDGTYYPEPVVAPLQLTWAFPQFHELFPTVVTSDTCDFGHLDEDAARFTLATYVTPNNFRGHVEAGQAMQVHLIASAHNVDRTKPLVLEVSWDGQWSSDMEEMKRLLVI
ncbi:MAG: hypothetical protein AB7O28_26110 [Vicinamibacterales bacterium]